MRYSEYHMNTMLKKAAENVVEGSSVKTFPSARDFVIRDYMGYKPGEPREAMLRVPNGDIKVRIESEHVSGCPGEGHRHEIELDVMDPIIRPASKTRYDEVDAIAYSYSSDDAAVTKGIHEASRSIIPVWIITKVIFNDPATIVYWRDGSRTVVKAMDGEQFDPEKGLAMAICKRLLGTSESGGNYYDIFKKWLPKESEEKVEAEAPRSSVSLPVLDDLEALSEAIKTRFIKNK